MDNTNWADLCEAGQTHFQAREYEEAAACFRKATDIQPASAVSWRALGFSLNACSRHSEAISAFQSAIGLEPNEAEGYFGAGLAYAANAEFERAINSLDEALKFKPNHARAKIEVISLLLAHGKALLDAGDIHAGEQALERAYKLDEPSAQTVLPFVEQLIVARRHKKAFDTIRAASAAAPNDARIRDLAARMEADPNLAHAKGAQAVRPQQRQPVKPKKPAQNPDEVMCPCRATMVMKWATVCPTCNQKIDNPAVRPAGYVSSRDFKGYNWIDVCYYVISALWLLYGLLLCLLGLIAGGGFGGFVVAVGVVNAGVAIGLLYQLEWLQFVAKLLMVINFLFGSWNLMVGVGVESPGRVIFGFFVAAAAGFSWWIISQRSD